VISRLRAKDPAASEAEHENEAVARMNIDNVNVAQLRRPLQGAFRKSRVVLQQMPLVLQVEIFIEPGSGG
jgi:hypothetical protein